MTLRLLLADDHHMLREGLRRSMIDHGFDVVGQAADGGEAVQMAVELQPDVILMDIAMPTIDGVEATHRILERCPGTRIVMLTVDANQATLASAIEAGACGHLVKDCSPAEIASALHVAASGDSSP